jgi:hypothetical protein
MVRFQTLLLVLGVVKITKIVIRMLTQLDLNLVSIQKCLLISPCMAKRFGLLSKDGNIMLDPERRSLLNTILCHGFFCERLLKENMRRFSDLF